MADSTETTKKAPPKSDDAGHAPGAGAKDITPAQAAAAQFELRRPSKDRVAEGIWGNIGDGDVGGVVVNGNINEDYRFLVATDYPADGRALHQARQELADRGFEPISGPLYTGPTRREFVAGRAAVELWSRPKALADDEWRASLAKSCLSSTWAQMYWRRSCMEGAPQVRWLPEALEYATLVVHGLAKDTKNLRPTREHIIALARRAPVHPAGTSKSDPLRDAFAQLR